MGEDLLLLLLLLLHHLLLSHFPYAFSRRRNLFLLMDPLDIW
jgi:hypothetical protein